MEQELIILEDNMERELVTLEEDIEYIAPKLQTKALEITQNGNTSISYDLPYGGLDRVNITTDVHPTGTIEIFSNGTHDIADYGIADVQVETELKHGSFVLAQTADSWNIDIGFPHAKRMVVFIHKTSGTNTARTLGTQFIDFDNNYRLCQFATASNNSSYATASTYKLNDENYWVHYNGNIVEAKGLSSLTGRIYAGIQYDWIAW